MADIRRREEVENRYKWDLTHIFPNDEAWEAAMQQALADAQAFAAFDGKVAEDPRKVIRAIREKEIRCGISISPGTPAELLLPYLSEVDMVLIMTVVPGFGGQALIPSCLEKVRFIRQYADRHGLRLDIEVDGGIREDNIGLATEAGANVIVAGSAIFGSKKPRSVIEGMRKAAEAHPYQA